MIELFFSDYGYVYQPDKLSTHRCLIRRLRSFLPVPGLVEGVQGSKVGEDLGLGYKDIFYRPRKNIRS